MKRLNGKPMVHFVNAVLDYDIPLAEAEQIMALQSIPARKEALLHLLRRSEISDCSVTDYVFAEFVKALGASLAEQRGKELRQLAAPSDNTIDAHGNRLKDQEP